MQPRIGKAFYNLMFSRPNASLEKKFLKDKSGNSASVCLAMLNHNADIFIYIITPHYALMATITKEWKTVISKCIYAMISQENMQSNHQ